MFFFHFPFRFSTFFSFLLELRLDLEGGFYVFVSMQECGHVYCSCCLCCPSSCCQYVASGKNFLNYLFTSSILHHRFRYALTFTYLVSSLLMVTWSFLFMSGSFALCLVAKALR